MNSLIRKKQVTFMRMKKIISSVCFLFLFSHLWADMPLSARFLTNNDGLSNSSVNCILQDSSKLIWFGTWDGLNLYTGSNLRIFKPNPAVPGSISNNIIRDIVQEQNGTLWIETDNGINRYHPGNKSFDHFLISNASIFKEHSYLICKNSRDQLFASVYESGIFFFSKKKNDFIRLDAEGIKDAKKIFFDNHDQLWVFTYKNELHRINLNYSGNDQFPSIASTRKAETGKNIESVFYNHIRDQIWIQDKSNLIFFVDPSNGKVKESDLQVREPLASVLFLHGQSWIGTTSSLYEADETSGQIHLRWKNISVLSILKDSQGTLWVGTDAQGVLMLTRPKEKFLHFSSGNVPDLGTSPVRAFFEDAGGALWVGTKGNGLHLISENRNGTMENRRFTPENGLLSNSVYALAGEPGKELWIGTEGNGLNYYDFSTKKLFTLKTGSPINLVSIYSIYRQDDTTLWIGTSGYGLYRLRIDRKTHPYSIKEQTQYIYRNHGNSLTNNVVYSIIPDNSGYLWIGTRGGGLNRLDIGSQTFENYRYDPSNDQSISNDDILCLYKDKQNTLWVGTSNGLNKLEKLSDKTASFRRYSEKDGIPNNTIHGILSDAEGNLWLSSNKGLSKLNPDKDKVIAYFQSDGLQNNEFSDGAFYSSPQSSMLYFGGINGYNQFDPLKISKDSYMPPLYLDAFFINNEEVDLADYMIKENNSGKLKITYQQKFFSFKFIPLDYLDAIKCKLSYRLQNYNKEWIDLGTSRTIVFSNLPAGNYVLHVRCSNADKEWSEHVFSLPIRIFPPWWLSWYAYLIYFVLIAALVYFLHRISRNRIEMRHRLELTKLENQQAEEIHQAKLRFFTNIAHEFCNSLTLIYGPSEQLLRFTDNDSSSRKYLNIIKSNAERMQGLIQQLMEFRKAETGYLEIHVESVDIPELIKYTTDHFIEMAEQKKINFTVHIDPAVDHWPTDRSCFEKILFNLLSNAFKYTPEQGNILLQITMKDKTLQMSVSNTGPGIKEDDQKQLFNRFTILDQLENQVLKGYETRTGIGLALCKTLVNLLQGEITLHSEPNKDTTFTVSLKPLIINDKKERKEEFPISSAIAHPEKQKTYAILQSEKYLSSEREKPCILIIEDDPEIRMLLTDILQAHYEIMTASAGKEAFELLQDSTPDLILCDVIMPGINGIEVVKQLKQQEVTAHIPIIFLSSEGSVESQIEGLRVGADAYLTKPFHTRHLEAAIEQLLNRQQNMKEYFRSPISSIENMEGRPVHKEEKEFIIRLTKIVTENIDNEKLSLDTLSNEIGVSKIQLYRKLKDIKGETPTEFIRKIRLKQAEKLLKTTNKTVQEIMYSCGFNNKAYFYREFSKVYNQTPKEYRNRFI